MAVAVDNVMQRPVFGQSSMDRMIYWHSTGIPLAERSHERRSFLIDQLRIFFLRVVTFGS
jgi:hypothetical protein